MNDRHDSSNDCGIKRDITPADREAARESDKENFCSGCVGVCANVPLKSSEKKFLYKVIELCRGEWGDELRSFLSAHDAEIERKARMDEAEKIKDGFHQLLAREATDTVWLTKMTTMQEAFDCEIEKRIAELQSQKEGAQGRGVADGRLGDAPPEPANPSPASGKCDACKGTGFRHVDAISYPCDVCEDSVSDKEIASHGEDAPSKPISFEAWCEREIEVQESAGNKDRAIFLAVFVLPAYRMFDKEIVWTPTKLAEACEKMRDDPKITTYHSAWGFLDETAKHLRDRVKKEGE